MKIKPTYRIVHKLWYEWFNSTDGNEDFANWILENYSEIKSVELSDYDSDIKEIKFHPEATMTQFLLKYG